MYIPKINTKSLNKPARIPAPPHTGASCDRVPPSRSEGESFLRSDSNTIRTGQVTGANSWTPQVDTIVDAIYMEVYGEDNASPPSPITHGSLSVTACNRTVFEGVSSEVLSPSSPDANIRAPLAIKVPGGRSLNYSYTLDVAPGQAPASGVVRITFVARQADGCCD